MFGVWVTTLVKDSRHVWSLIYHLSEGFKACLESGLYLSEGFKACLESGLLP